MFQFMLLYIFTKVCVDMILILSFTQTFSPQKSSEQNVYLFFCFSEI